MPARKRTSNRKDPEEFVHTIQRPSIISEVIRLHGLGHCNLYIAEAVSASRSGIRKLLTRWGLTSNRERAEKKSAIKAGEHEWLCVTCNTVKSIQDWETKGGRPSGSQCKQCKKLSRLMLVNNNVCKNLKTRWTELKTRCNKDDVVFLISFEDFEKQWERQKGLCFYTDFPLSLERGVGHQQNSISVDKIEPKHGYVVGNVVLCSMQANTIKSNMSLPQMADWMPGWFNRIVDFWALKGYNFGPLS